MTSRLLIGSLLLLVAGCSTSRVDEVPGTIHSGPVDDVVNRAGAGGTHFPIDAIGVTRVGSDAKPTIPALIPEQVVPVYCFKRVSKDPQRRAKRDGVYLYIKVRGSEWADVYEMENNRLNLRDLQNIHLDENGQIVVNPNQTVEPRPDDVQGIRAMATQLPWRDGGAGTATRTNIVYSNGQATTLPAAPAGNQGATPNPYLGPNGQVNTAEVQRAIEEARRLNASYDQNAVRPTPAAPAGQR